MVITGMFAGSHKPARVAFSLHHGGLLSPSRGLLGRRSRILEILRKLER